jgi:hypothetical protein
MPRHRWAVDEDGDVDTLAWEYAHHHGPACLVCNATPCVNCEPAWEALDDCTIVELDVVRQHEAPGVTMLTSARRPTTRTEDEDGLHG